MEIKNFVTFLFGSRLLKEWVEKVPVYLGGVCTFVYP